MPLLFLHLHTCKCLITCWIHILKYCLRHNGSNIYMPKKYLSATLWETICTHFSHRCWIFAIFRRNKSSPTPANKLSVSCQQSTLSPLKLHNSATHTLLFYTTHSTILQRTNRQTYGQIHRARLSAVIVSWLNIPRLRLHLFPFRGCIHIRRHGKAAPTAANNLLFRCKQTTITLLTTWCAPYKTLSVAPANILLHSLFACIRKSS